MRLKIHLLNMYVGIYNRVIRYVKPLQIMGLQETIDYIIDNQISATRFGDGELRIITENYSIAFQKFDGLLKEMLKEVLLFENRKCLVCIPGTLLCFDGMKEESILIWKECYKYNLRHFIKLFSKKRIYGNSLFTRPYMDYGDYDESKNIFNSIKKIWDNRTILIVEGEGSHLGVGNDLFDGAQKIKRIICPAENAFIFYKQIKESVISNASEVDVVLIALGPTATVLAYELSLENVWAIDIGHVDIEYEWWKQKAKKKIAVEGKYVNEVKKGRVIELCTDSSYLSQIIERIK